MRPKCFGSQWHYLLLTLPDFRCLMTSTFQSINAHSLRTTAVQKRLHEKTTKGSQPKIIVKKSKWSMETLLTDVKLVALKTSDFQNRLINSYSKTPFHYWPIKTPITGKQSERVRPSTHLIGQHSQFRPWRKKFKAVISEKKELEYWDIPLVKALLPLLANKNSISNSGKKFTSFRNKWYSSSNVLSIDTPMKKWSKQSWRSTSLVIKVKISLWHFWSVKIQLQGKNSMAFLNSISQQNYNTFD